MNFVKLWQGKADKKIFNIYLYSVLLFWLSGIAIGLVFFENFQLDMHYTSYIGAKEYNPDGYIYYNLISFFSGILLIPLFNTLNVALLNSKSSKQPFRKATYIFGVLSVVGISLLAIFHQGTNADLHRMSSNITFGGAFLSILSMVFAFIYRLNKKEAWPNMKLAFIPFIVFIFTLLPAFTIQFWPVPDVYKDKHFGEWFFIFTIFWTYASIGAILPKSPQSI